MHKLVDDDRGCRVESMFRPVADMPMARWLAMIKADVSAADADRR